jgi:ribosomal protein S18 acetylase RimI-like enzyme
MRAIRPLKGLWLRMRVDGVVPTLEGLLEALRPKVWYIYKLVGMPPARDAGCIIDSDLTRLASLRKLKPGLASEYFRDEARRAARGFFALADGQLAGVVWILDTRYPSRVIRLGPSDVELAFLYVENEFRGRGIARALIQEACRVLPHEGVTAIYSIIEEHNVPSQKAFLASGFQRIAALRRPLLFGPRFHTTADRMPSAAE